MIYLCRHGQTEFNTRQRYQGQVDSPLTDLGQAQARAMGRRLAELIKGDFRLYASPLGRAHHSALLIAEALGGAEIIPEPRLMEIAMGAWDGLDDIEIEAEYPGARAGLPPGTWWFHSPDGETYDAFTTRIAAAMADISSDPAPVKIIVSHGVVGRVIRGQHSGLPKAQALVLSTPQDAVFALLPKGVVQDILC